MSVLPISVGVSFLQTLKASSFFSPIWVSLIGRGWQAVPSLTVLTLAKLFSLLFPLFFYNAYCINDCTFWWPTALSSVIVKNICLEVLNISGSYQIIIYLDKDASKLPSMTLYQFKSFPNSSNAFERILAVYSAKFQRFLILMINNISYD